MCAKVTIVILAAVVKQIVKIHELLVHSLDVCLYVDHT